jgi:hypothetical protein
MNNIGLAQSVESLFSNCWSGRNPAKIIKITLKEMIQAQHRPPGNKIDFLLVVLWARLVLLPGSS